MADPCTICGDPIHPGQRHSERGDAHASCVIVTRQPADRCMGRRCDNPAEYAISALDENKAVHDHPVKLCKSCLLRLDAAGGPVDVFRWLTEGRIEATSFQ